MRWIDEFEFAVFLKPKLGDLYERAFTIFKNYSGKLAFDVTNLLLLAADRNKVDEVLSMFEKHYHEFLRFKNLEELEILTPTATSEML
ncbi:MAG: hypothetical protein AAB340_00220, partial [Patescibacteria group bacterium]